MIKRNKKILHVAAMIGNVGDDASHFGLHKILARTLNSYDLHQLNIRKAYNTYDKSDKLRFDKNFVDYMNSYDFCIFGGGAFLDHPVVGSQHGATIDFPIECLEAIQCRVLFSSIGCRPKSNSATAKKNIKIYLDAILNNKNCDILLRNDGSYKYLKEINFHNERIYQILDHGFFIDKNLTNTEAYLNEKYACVNVVHDQQSFYGNLKAISEKKYYKIAASYIERLAKMDIQKIYLVPHIYQDFLAIARVLDLLDANMVAEKIVVPQLKQGEEGARFIFSLYRNSMLNIGTRFHMNVCSLAFGTPTIPLAITKRIQELYVSLGGDTRMYENENEIDTHLRSVLGGEINLLTHEIGKEKQKTVEIYESLLT